MKLTTMILFLCCFLSIASFAQDAASAEALSKTQELLKSPEQRQEAIRQSGDAQKADANVDKLTSNAATKEKIYSISGDAMKTLVDKTKGDSQAMQTLIEDAGKNPEAFMKSLPPDMQRQISEVAREIEGQGGAPVNAVK